MDVQGILIKTKLFFRKVRRFCAAAVRLARRFWAWAAKALNTLWILFWRTAIILTAKFLSGASVRWIKLEADPPARLSRAEAEEWKRREKEIEAEPCQRVYFANHTSHLDSIVIWTVLPERERRNTRMVAAYDYWTAGPFRRFLSRKVFNALLIDRKHISFRNNPVNQMIKEMGTDHSIIIFPEGGRGNGEKINEFKSGIYHIAKKKPELELIPIYLDNMNRILPRGNVFPVPMLSRIVFGPPIWIENGEQKEAFLARCREAILKLKDL